MTEGDLNPDLRVVGLLYNRPTGTGRAGRLRNEMLGSHVSGSSLDFQSVQVSIIFLSRVTQEVTRTMPTTAAAVAAVAESPQCTMDLHNASNASLKQEKKSPLKISSNSVQKFSGNKNEKRIPLDGEIKG